MRQINEATGDEAVMIPMSYVGLDGQAHHPADDQTEHGIGPAAGITIVRFLRPHEGFGCAIAVLEEEPTEARDIAAPTVDPVR